MKSEKHWYIEPCSIEEIVEQEIDKSLRNSTKISAKYKNQEELYYKALHIILKKYYTANVRIIIDDYSRDYIYNKADAMFNAWTARATAFTFFATCIYRFMMGLCAIISLSCISELSAQQNVVIEDLGAIEDTRATKKPRAAYLYDIRLFHCCRCMYSNAFSIYETSI